MLRGRGRGGIVTMPDPEAITGLIFPSNGDAGGTVQFRFSGANLPNIVPLTLLWKYYPIQHTGYHTTFFHGPGDGSFIATPTYFGCHPYPNAGDTSNHKWEISIEGLDDVVDENANSTAVTKAAWYTQAASTRASGADSIVDFYWNLAVSTNRIISHTVADGLTNSPDSPCIVFGDAPWNPTSERLSGRLRGLQIYNAQLSEAHMDALADKDTNAEVLAYCSANSITSAWYLNMNPTPDDITDKSGAGHDPSWLNANRPTLWEQ